IDYYKEKITDGELKIVYLEFSIHNDNSVELIVHCYHLEEDFQNLLVKSVQDIMIENSLNKIIFPLHSFPRENIVQ
ncbi:MAG: hypothetical protein H0U27_05915, partial [Nitrosopumilus sp.]|nr:hypothetical protein [Nitrosopumilus sp.]